MELYNNIQENLSKRNINVTVGNIYDMMAVWKSWYRGNVNDFHYYTVKLTDGKTVEKERRTLNMAKKCCEDFSKLEWSEKVEIKLDNENNTDELFKVLDSKKNSFSTNFLTFLEKVYALGNGLTVEYIDNDETIIDYIDGDVILPYKYTNSYINGIITVSRFEEKINDKETIYYTHLTYHEYDNNTYTKLNELYKSKSVNELGMKIDFNSKFPNVLESEIIETEHPRFQVWKLPIANNFDTNNPLGISIFANHIDKLKNIDTKYDSFNREFVNGKKRIMIDEKAVKSKIVGADSNGDPIRVTYFDKDDDVYVAMAGMEGQPVKDIDFKLRVEEHINAINSELNYLSSGLGLGNGFYKFDSEGVKTATEVISENSDTYRTKVHHQIPIYNNLYDMIASICEMNNISYKEISITFDDSIVQDEDALLNRGIQLYQNGLLSADKFMKKYLHYEDAEIEEEKLKLKEDRVTGTDIDFFGTTNKESDN